jgi:DNA-binding transcriptional regulator YiaG
MGRPMHRKRVLRPEDAPVTPTELRTWRRALEWTQERAARHLGFSRRTYEKWEQGYKSPAHPVSVRKLMALAKPRRVLL